jgi:hypothetical protein
MFHLLYDIHGLFQIVAWVSPKLGQTVLLFDILRNQDPFSIQNGERQPAG